MLEYLLRYGDPGPAGFETVQEFTLHLTDGNDTFDIATDDLEIDLFDEDGHIIGADGHGLTHVSGGAGEDTITTDVNTLILSQDDDGVDHYTIVVDQAGVETYEPGNVGAPVQYLHYGHAGSIQSPGFEDHVTVHLADDIEGYVHQVNHTVSWPQPSNQANEGSAFIGVLVTDSPTAPEVIRGPGDYSFYEAVLLHIWKFDSQTQYVFDDDGNVIDSYSPVDEQSLASLTFTGRDFDTIEPLELPSTTA
jgi:hypothetical protein